MKTQGAQSVFKSLLAVSLLLLTVSAVGGPEAAQPSFVVLPENPAVGRGVLFRGAAWALAEASSSHWDFGDGEVSSLPSPVHVYRLPGVYTVKLTASTASGPRVVTELVEVSADNTLRLLSGRFEVTLSARDQRTGRSGEGLAIPQNDLFGFFSIPDITGDPDNPEMFVKMLDGRTINGQFWFFYNGLTDLDVTLTVREVPTGVVKTYRKDPGSACGGFDTSGFTPTGPTATPTSLPPTPTRTPTPPSGTTVVNLLARRFDWNFNGAGPTFQMRVGQPYQLRIRNSDPSGPPHSFTGIPSIGLSGTSDLQPSGPAVIRNFTPSLSNIGTHQFFCGRPSCGVGHPGMAGSIQIVQ